PPRKPSPGSPTSSATTSAESSPASRCATASRKRRGRSTRGRTVLVLRLRRSRRLPRRPRRRAPLGLLLLEREGVARRPPAEEEAEHEPDDEHDRDVDEVRRGHGAPPAALSRLSSSAISFVSRRCRSQSASAAAASTPQAIAYAAMTKLRWWMNFSVSSFWIM